MYVCIKEFPVFRLKTKWEKYAMKDDPIQSFAFPLKHFWGICSQYNSVKVINVTIMPKIILWAETRRNGVHLLMIQGPVGVSLQGLPVIWANMTAQGVPTCSYLFTFDVCSFLFAFSIQWWTVFTDYGSFVGVKNSQGGFQGFFAPREINSP